MDIVSKEVLSKPTGIGMYRIFYPRDEKSIYTFFMENADVQQPWYTENLYEIIKDCDEFNIDEFMKVMVNAIPSFNGFSDADAFMNSFKAHIKDLSIDSVEEITKIYPKNHQCTNRTRHSADIAYVNKYIEDHKSTHDAEGSSFDCNSDE